MRRAIIATALVGALVACSKKERQPTSKPETRPAQRTRPRAPTPRKSRPVQTVPARKPTQPAGSQGGLVRWDFEKAAVGSLPAGWKVATGTWKVVEDKTAPAGPKVLAQQAKSPDDVFNVAYVEKSSEKDLTLSVHLKPVAGRVDQGGGLVWRLKDGKNYYIARYNPLEDNFRVYKVVAGHRKMLQSAKVKLPHEGWHTVKVAMTGDHIECWLDGKKYLDTHDTTFPEAGAYGLWTKADAQTNFDALEVRPATAPAAPRAQGEPRPTPGRQPAARPREARGGPARGPAAPRR